VPLYQLVEPLDATDPTMVVAFDTWVDAGAAATTAVEELVTDSRIVARFDPDALFDYRARRPPLEIRDGRLAELTWPELTVRHASIGGRDLLAFCGPEPDYRWREFGESVAELVETPRGGRVDQRRGHPCGRSAHPGRADHRYRVRLRRPDERRQTAGRTASCVFPRPRSRRSRCVSPRPGIPALGYFAQIPHYVSGPYPAAALELLDVLSRHLGVPAPDGRTRRGIAAAPPAARLAAAADESTRSYVERLESMVDEARLPAGDELISEIERFLRQQGSQGDRPN
jgi:hypothetical protein